MERVNREMELKAIIFDKIRLIEELTLERNKFLEELRRLENAK